MTHRHTSRTTDYLVRLDRTQDRLMDPDARRDRDDSYHTVGRWGVPGGDHDVEDYALLMVLPGSEEQAEALMDADPAVVSYERHREGDEEARR